MLQEAVSMIKWGPTAALLFQTSVIYTTEIIFMIQAGAKYRPPAVTGSVDGVAH